MATYGYIENTSGSRLVIESLGISMPAGFTEEWDEDDVRGFLPLERWKRAVPELQALITAGDIEVRESDNTTVIPSSGIQAWVDSETLTLTSLPSDIGSSKMDITTAESMITRLVAGTGINIASTGFLSGTGVVTVNNTGPTSNFIIFESGLSSKVNGSNGSSKFMMSAGVSHSEVGFYLPVAATLKWFVFGVNKSDSTRDFDIDLLSDPAGSPSITYTDNLPTSQTLIVETSLSVAMAAGSYGIEVTKNGNGSSKWNKAYALIGVQF